MPLVPLNVTIPATGANFRVFFTLPKGRLVHISVGNDTAGDTINVDLIKPGDPVPSGEKPFHELINNESTGIAEYVLWDGEINVDNGWVVQATFQIATAADICNLNVLVETKD